MFTLIRPLSGALLAIFALFAAQEYVPLYNPDANLGKFPVYVALVAFVVGWWFLGSKIGRSLWFSAFIAVQAVVLTAVGSAMLFAVREVFIQGYRRRYREPMDAVTGYVDIVMGWLGKALVQDYLILLAGGGVVLGVILHIMWLGLEGRRNAR